MSKITFQIMNHTGHDTEAFDKADKVSVEEAKRRFDALRGEGKIAVDVEGKRVMKDFEPVETVRFQPHLVGG